MYEGRKGECDDRRARELRRTITNKQKQGETPVNTQKDFDHFDRIKWRLEMDKKETLGCLHLYLFIFLSQWLPLIPIYPAHSVWLSLCSLLSTPSSRSGTVSLPWLGGCNLLQAAGQAERSPSYLDKGSPGKSYQSEGVFKYSRNCGNHFLQSLQPPPPALKAPPSVALTFFLLSPQQAPAIPNSLAFFPLTFQHNLRLPQRFLL